MNVDNEGKRKETLNRKIEIFSTEIEIRPTEDNMQENNMVNGHDDNLGLLAAT